MEDLERQENIETHENVCFFNANAQIQFKCFSPMGPTPKKGIKKEAMLSKNGDLLMSSSFSKNICLGGRFWKYKPHRGAAGDETLVFGNQNVTRKAGFEKCSVDFL